MRLFLFFCMSTVLLACQPVDCTNGVQDGNETGIDCGGDCPSCSSGTPQNTPPTDLLKLWYKTMQLATLTNQTGGTYSKISTLYYNNNCHVEFTSNPSTTASGFLTCYGMINQCTYPNELFYEFNQTNNTIAGYNYNLVTSDSVIFDGNGGSGAWHYKSSQPVAPTQESIQWEVELNSAYPNNGEVSINVWVNNTLVNTVPVVSGQTLYSGTSTVNLSVAQPKILINVNTSVTTSGTNTISFTKRLKRNGLVLSNTGIGTYAVGTGFGGYDPLVGGAPCQIQWQ